METRKLTLKIDTFPVYDLTIGGSSCKHACNKARNDYSSGINSDVHISSIPHKRFLKMSLLPTMVFCFLYFAFHYFFNFYYLSTIIFIYFLLYYHNFYSRSVCFVEIIQSHSEF